MPAIPAYQRRSIRNPCSTRRLKQGGGGTAGSVKVLQDTLTEKESLHLSEYFTTAFQTREGYCLFYSNSIAFLRPRKNGQQDVVLLKTKSSFGSL